MYYLPIKIRRTRLHYCAMDMSEDAKCVYPSNYIFRFDQEELLSVDMANTELISEKPQFLQGHFYFADPKLIENEKYKLIDDSGGELAEYPIFEIELKKGQETKTYADNGPLYFAKPLSEESNTNLLILHYNYEKITNLKTSEGESVFAQRDKKGLCFILRFLYKVNEVRYEHYLRCIIVSRKETDEGKIVRVALDYGSESSQMQCQINSPRIPIITEMENLVPHELNYQNLVYRQTKMMENDRNAQDKGEFKSIFFLNHTPEEPVCWGDQPMRGGDRTLLRTLIPRNTPAERYRQWEQLPNLKLLELISSQMIWDQANIAIPKGSTFTQDYIQDPRIDLNNSIDRDKLLRYIISQFLWVAMNSQRHGRYLDFIILVPNVYTQEKVSQLITGLYRDFDLIRLSNDSMRHWLGIEIHTLSESDASFLGFIETSYRKYKMGNVYSLIIDVGKGTTDFSIIQGEKDDASCFHTMYRAGIPIAGNFITYGIYERLRDWFIDHDVDVPTMLRTADPATKIEFMDTLDKLKAQYKGTTFTEEIPAGTLSPTVQTDLTKITKLINDHFLADGQIPLVENKKDPIKECCNKIASMLEQYLLHYISGKSDFHFSNVIFMGRGFRFRPLADAVKTMLNNNGWANNNDYRKVDDADLKRNCLKGALCYRHNDINNQSNLIGRISFVDPAINENVANQSKNGLTKVYEGFKTWIKCLAPIELVSHSGKDFYLNGTDASNPNKDIYISCFRYHPDKTGLGQNRRIFFVGDRFVITDGNQMTNLETSPINEVNAKCVIASLFPYWRGTIVNANRTTSISAQQNIVLEQSKEMNESNMTVADV